MLNDLARAKRRRKEKKSISEQIYFANFFARRMVKFLATIWTIASTVSMSPQYSSAAMVMKSRANSSCMDVSEIVSFTCSHKAGSAPRLSGWGRKHWSEVGSCSSLFPACLGLQQFPFPWDHLAYLGSVDTTALHQ